MAGRLFSIIKRNSLITLNSKFSALMLILAPIFLMLIAGSVLKDTSLKNVRVGVYSAEQGEFFSSIMARLEARSFLAETSASLEECRQRVISGENQLCVEIVKDENIPPGKYSSAKFGHSLVLYVDFSKQKTVWEIIGTVQGIAEQESNQIKDSIITDIHGNIDYILKTSEKANTQIDSVISSLDQISSYLDQVSRTVNTLSQDINSAKTALDSAWQDFAEIKTKLGDNATLISVPLNRLQIHLSQIETGIKSTKNNLDDSSIVAQIFNSKLALVDAKIKLLQVKKDMNSREDELRNAKNLDLNRLTNPVPLTYKSVINNNQGTIENKLGFLDYLFPSLLIIYMLFSSIFFSALLVIRERMSGAHVRNILSRTSGFLFVLGNFLTCFIATLAQVTLLLVIGNYFLNITLFPNILTLLWISLAAITIFTFAGMTIGYFFNSQESVSIFSISLVTLFLIFSSSITPKEIMPEFFSKLVSVTPTVIFENKMITALIFGMKAGISATEAISLGVVFLLIIAVLALSYIKAKRIELKGYI